jgi:hypothetical protein
MDNFDNIPTVITGQKKWTVFEIVGVEPDGKKKKEIRNPDGGIVTTGNTEPENMARFGDVVALCRKYPGRYVPGYHVEYGSKIYFGDADDVDVCPDYPTYTERSMSPRSYHMLAWYDGEECPVVKGWKENYIGGRWVALTGDIVDGKKDILYIDDLEKNITSYKAKKGEPHKLEEGKEIYGKQERYNTVFASARSDKCRNRPYDVCLAGMLEFNKNHFIPMCTEAYIERAVRHAYTADDSPEWKKEQEYLKHLDAAGCFEGDVDEDEEIKYEDLSEEAKKSDKKSKEKMSAAVKSLELPPFPGTSHPIFKEWMSIGQELSYSRVPFHYFGLLTVLSMVLGKRVRVILSGKSVYANIYTMLLGTTSVSGKSFAMDMITDAGRFLQRIQTIIQTVRSKNANGVMEETVTKTNVISMIVEEDKLTEPRLVQELAKVNDTMLWLYDECQPLFTAASVGLGATMLPQLCKVYDGKKVSSKLSISKKKKGDDNDYEWVCEQPFGSFLWAMTTDQFDKLASSEQANGGFLPRFIMVYEEGGEVRENSDITPDMQKRIDNVVESVGKIADIMCQLKNNQVSFKVCSRIEKWKVEETNKYLAPEFMNRRVAIQRAFIQAYKIAMILSIFDIDFISTVKGGSVDLPEKWVEESLNIVNKYLLPRMEKILEMANDENSKSDMTKIMRVIRSNGGSATKTKIGKNTHIEKSMLSKALDSLIENKEIEKTEGLENGHWVTRYCLKK